MAANLKPAIAATASLTTSIVNPVLEATVDTFDMMLDCQVKKRQLSLKTHETPFMAITAVIGLTGKAVGAICLSFSQEAAFEAVRRLTDVEVTEVNGLVCDAVGEFANVIAGSAKDRIVQMEMEMGLPNVVRGTNHQIDFPSNSQPLCVIYDSDIGPFMVVFGFVSKL